MNKYENITIRFNLENPEDRLLWNKVSSQCHKSRYIKDCIKMNEDIKLQSISNKLDIIIKTLGKKTVYETIDEIPEDKSIDDVIDEISEGYEKKSEAKKKMNEFLSDYDV
ncbi:hypothetical protein [Eubacterium sp.]|uniref:hypothetical protein n=1 Tax=Eubacterium sp. TaxID=142586 RepID=UPI0025F5B9A4|nr:hypothetical protein [Eubacterium sp.]MCR5628628.1 hypothetical protein [Eubacterium sp.]